MLRVMLFDRYDQPLGELSENDVFGLTRVEEVNGEHSLTITTTRVLSQGWRVLTCDERGKWREHVVYGTDALHESGDRPIGTYYCVWSLQPDMMGARVSRMPGVETPVSARVALGYAIEGTSRWQVGTVTDDNEGGASMYDTDCWSALSTLVANWGGELDTTIEVGDHGVIARLVDLYAKQGDQEAKRRFDFAADLRSVRRTVEDGPLYCRITPRGKGVETDEGGYGRKITIESVNEGKDYLVNDDMVDIAKLPDGSGGWEYPTLEVENPECETPEELLEWAQSVLEAYTLPKVTYAVDVLQAAQEGVDMHGVSLGDAVQVVDGKFGDGLRMSGRVVKATVNMLDENDAKLVIGHVIGGLDDLIGLLDARVDTLAATVQQMNGGTFSTAEYLSRLLARMNAEINETGGYTYITEGQGIRTYDHPVEDPLVGAEASSVVEIKGGTMRIANSKTAQGEWQWKTVFTSGHIASEMVTAATITAGYIGGASGNNFWNLDNGNFSLKDGTSGYGITKTNGTLTIDGSVINVQRLYPREIIAPDKSYGLAFRSPTTYSQLGDSLILLANPTGSNPIKLAHFDVGAISSSSYSSAFRLWDTANDQASIMVSPSGGSGAVFTDKNGHYVMIDVNGMPRISLHTASGAWADMGVLNGKFYITARNSDSTHYSQITFNPGSNPTLSSG